MAFIIIRCFILYFIVIFAVRMMGKRQIGELQPIELVITLLISELASMPIQNPDQPLLTGVIPILTLAGIEIFVSILTLKSIKLRYFLYGKPIIMIRKGKIAQHEMKKARVSVDDLTEAMRTNGVSKLENIEYAVLETNGNMSIIEKKKDTEEMPSIIIIDGNLIHSNLEGSNLTEEKVLSILKDHGVLSIKDIFILTIDSNGKTFIVKKECKN